MLDICDAERSTNENNSASADPFMSIDESLDVFEVSALFAVPVSS